MTGGATDEELAEHAARPRPFRPPPPRHMPKTKAKGRTNSNKMRVGKNINDAAEALLGMGTGFADDEILVSIRLDPWGCNCDAVVTLHIFSLPSKSALWWKVTILCSSIENGLRVIDLNWSTSGNKTPHLCYPLYLHPW